MERYYTQLVRSGVMTEDGLLRGIVQDVVVEPSTGKVAGFLLYPRGEKALTPNDILACNQNLVISDEDSIADTEDIIRIKKIIDLQTPIFKNKVFTKKGQYLGDVVDFTIHDGTFMLTKILVAKTFFWFFLYDEKIITFHDIIEIKKDRIIVKNPVRLIPIKSKKDPALKANLHIDIAPTG